MHVKRPCLVTLVRPAEAGLTERMEAEDHDLYGEELDNWLSLCRTLIEETALKLQLPIDIHECQLFEAAPVPGTKRRECIAEADVVATVDPPWQFVEYLTKRWMRDNILQRSVIGMVRKDPEKLYHFFADVPRTPVLMQTEAHCKWKHLARIFPIRDDTHEAIATTMRRALMFPRD